MDYISTQVKSQIIGMADFIKGMPSTSDRKALITHFLRCADELRDMLDDEIRVNTRINYLYRDAGNYKMCNSEIIAGKMTDAQFEELKSCCEDGIEEFIPEQVGMSLLRGWQTTEDDTPYCELQNYEFTNYDPSMNITIEELLERFREAKGKWDSEKYWPEIEDSEWDGDE